MLLSSREMMSQSFFVKEACTFCKVSASSSQDSNLLSGDIGCFSICTPIMVGIFCVCLHYFSLLQHLLVSWFTDCVSTTHIPNLVKCFRRHRPYHPSPSTTFSPLIGRRAVQSTKLTLEELVMDSPDSAFLLIS